MLGWALNLGFAAGANEEVVVAASVGTGGGSARPYRYLPTEQYAKRKQYTNDDDEELKRLVLEAEERNKEEINVLEKKSEELYRHGLNISQIKESVSAIQANLEKQHQTRLLFNIDLKLKLLEMEKRKNEMALLLLMAAA